LNVTSQMQKFHVAALFYKFGFFKKKDKTLAIEQISTNVAF
jgi:hypothetical protein